MSPLFMVILGIGTLFGFAIVRRFTSGKAITARQIAGLWFTGLILLLLGRISPQLTKGLMLLMVLATVLTKGFTTGLKIAALAPVQKSKPGQKSKTATPAPYAPTPGLGPIDQYPKYNPTRG